MIRINTHFPGFASFLSVSDFRFRLNLISLCQCLLLWLSIILTSNAADKITLRNLEVLRDCTVVSFDADGLVLAAERANGSKLVTWDEVESLTLESQQAEAVKLLVEVGPSLYAIQRRLLTGDDESLLAPAEKMAAIFRERRSRSACMVSLALMWGRLAEQRREEALEPWLRSYELLRTRAAKLGDLPGKRRPPFDPATALSWELEPVWFDSAMAKQVFPEVDAFVATMRTPIPEGAKLYLASLALAAGNVEQANALLDVAYEQEKSIALQKILRVQQECVAGKTTGAAEELQNALPKLTEELRPVALYWLGQAGVRSTNSAQREEAFVTLLRIPALHGRRSPDLSAAALFATFEHYREDRRLSARLRQELLEKYPATWHGRKALNIAAP